MNELPNLIPAARLRARRTAATIRAWATVHGASAVVLAAAWGLLAATRDQSPTALRAQVDQAVASVEEAQAGVKRATAELAALTRQLASAPDVRERPEWGVLLTLLGSVRGDAVSLGSLELTPAVQNRPSTRAGLPSHYRMRLTGLARDHSAATGFSLAVERTGLFSQVRLTDATSQSVRGGTAVAFIIECELQDGPEGAR